MAHEAAVYEFLTRGDSTPRGFLPGYAGYDAELGILILELVPGARDLRRHQQRTGRFAKALAEAVGAALAGLHRQHPQEDGGPGGRLVPWVFSIHQPDLSLFRDASSAGIELVKVIQSVPAFGEQLDGLRAGWRSTALIHGDVKWENILVSRGPHGAAGVRLIDWESASGGDPGWDIGCALGHYLSCWLSSIPVTGQDPPDRFPELARVPLARLRPAIVACWTAYAGGLGLAGPAAATALLRAVSYAAVRLVATAFEMAQTRTVLDGNLVLHLQLAFNMLDRPREAAAQLLGLAPGRGPG